MLKQIVAFIICGTILVSSLSGQQFQEVSLQSGVSHYQYSIGWMGGGVVLADFNNDNFLDIFLTGGSAKDGYYINNGNLTFTEMTDSAGMGILVGAYTMGAVSGDFNNDGWLDLFVTTVNNTPNFLFINQGDGTFSEIGTSAGIAGQNYSISAVVGDYNNDGYLDIYIGNYIKSNLPIFDNDGNIIGFNHTCYSNYLYKSNGDLTFTEVAKAYAIDDSMGCALAMTFLDIDFDYDADLYIGNDFGEFNTPNQTFQNNYPVNSFTNVSSATGMDISLFSMGIAKGDYDQDGDFDFYITNLGSNAFLLNNGNNQFTDVAPVLGVENEFANGNITTGWGTNFADFDNDTHLDLFVSNGKIQMPPGYLAPADQDPNKLYRNLGNGYFSDISDSAGIANTQYCRGSAVGDLDNDGDLDLVVANMSNVLTNNVNTLIYENISGNNKNYLQIRLEGTLSNAAAIGSIIKLYAGGKTLIQEIDGGSSHASQNSMIAHFGLDTISAIDSVLIFWPGGNIQKETALPVNKQIVITENIPSNICALPLQVNSKKLSPTSVEISWNGAYTGYSTYVLKGKKLGDPDWTYFNIGKLRNLTFNNLEANKTYIWQVKRSCDSLDQYWSKIDTFETLCAPPTQIWTNNISSSSATLNWTPSPSGSYLLMGQQLSSQSTVYIDVPGDKNTFQATGLSASTSYSWSIQSYCDDQKSQIEYSSTVDTFTTHPLSSKEENTLYITEDDIKVIPNPTSEKIDIILNQAAVIKEIVLVDLSGKIIMEKMFSSDINTAGNESIRFPEKIKNGLYFLSIRTGTGRYFQKRIMLLR